MENLLFEKAINTLYENGRMTFFQLKERIRQSSKFILQEKKVEDGREILLSYSINENKLLVADNKTHIKEGGKTIKEYIKTLQECQEDYSNSLNYLEQNINRMNGDDQRDIFGDGQRVYYKVKLLLIPTDGNNYNTNYFVPLQEGHCQYDESGKPVLTELTVKLQKFSSHINEWQQKSKAERFINESNAIQKLKELHNKEYVNLANSNINNCLNTVNSHINNDSFKLTDDSSINDYMLSRTYILLNNMLDGSEHAPYDSIAKMNIAKRVLGINGISYRDLNNILKPEQMSYVKDNILNRDSRNEFLNTAIKPIENSLIEYATNILKSTKSILLLENSINSRRTNKMIDNSLKFIDSSRSLKTLRSELMNLRFVDKQISNPKKHFYSEGKKCSLVSGYKPINELLNILKPLSENTDRQIITEKYLNDIIIEQVARSGDRYFLLSKNKKLEQR